MQVIVVLTADTDCDGTLFGAHKIMVPDEMYSVNDHGAILKYAHETEQISYYTDVVEDIMHIDRFLAQYPMSPEHTDRFHRLNYTSDHKGLSPSSRPSPYHRYPMPTTTRRRTS